MTSTLAIEAAPRGSATAPTVVGYVDAVASDRVFGWAWDPQRPAARLAIRAEIGGEVVAGLIADQPRTDLAENRIGDGAHSFELALPAGADAAATSIVAICPESGSAVPLAIRPAAAPVAGETTADETIARVVRAQRLLHHNLRAAMDGVETLRQECGAAAAKCSGEAAALAARIEVIDGALLRIDRLLQQHEATLKARVRQGTDMVSRVLAGGALCGAAAALALALLR
jgi:hypothetical protein